jgi:dienelactone hydrolase
VTARLALVLAVTAIAVPSAGAGSAAKGLNGSWVGTYSLGGAAAVTFTLSGRRAVVALGVGHAGAQTVATATTRGHVRFQLPGRPGPLVFDGRLRRGKLRGTVRQGTARGTFLARRGRSTALLAPGFYSAGGRTLAVVDDPYGPARLIDLGSGEVHAIYGSGREFAIGSGFATRAPVQGRARFDAAGAVIDGSRSPRLAVRQQEVRFVSGGVVLSGTLTTPVSPAPHAAVAFVHGSGFTTRSYLPELNAMLVRNGVAVLNYDKRGTGQSKGEYPGESPTEQGIDVLARDAAAAVRFLAAQPGIDPARVGLAGHSQAGWIAPLAASREPAIRFLLLFAGPTVTADENDVYQDLAGEGQTPQQLSDAEVDAEVLRRGRGGVDPMPWIRALRIPAFWAFGGLDKIIPTRLSVRQLAPLVADPSRDFSYAIFLRGNHALVETQTGLTAEMLRSSTYAPGLFTRVGDWLRSHGLTAVGRASSV